MSSDKKNYPSLRRNSVLTLLGSGVFSAAQWGIIVVIAKLGNASMVGEYALAVAINSPIFEFSNLQLRGVQATDAISEFHFRDYFSLRVMMAVSAVVVAVVVVALSGRNMETALLVLAVAATKFADSMSDIVYGLLQKHERMKDIATSLALRGVLSLGMLWSVLVFTSNLLLAVSAVALGWFATYVAFDMRRGEKLTVDYGGTYGACCNLKEATLSSSRRERILKLLWISLPMGGVMMLSSLGNTMPRYVIAEKMGSEALGYFAAINYIAIAGTMVVASVGRTVSPRLAMYFAERNLGAFRSLAKKLLLVAVLIGGGGVIAAFTVGKVILRVLYAEEYSAYSELLVWLMGVAMVAYVVAALGCIVTSMRIFRVQLGVHLIKALVVGILCLLFVGPFGLKGAAWSVGTGMIISAILYAIVGVSAIGRKMQVEKV